jgi:HAMP domain-containing protein/putative methionine-R-sulfoxide reductase with GAF domain
MTERAARVAPAIPRPRTSLGRRMALILLPLVLLPVIVIGATGYLRSRQILADQAEAQLTNVTTSQANLLADWAQERQQRLQLGSQLAALRDPLGHLLHDNPGPAERQALVDSLDPQLEGLRSSEGQVLFSQVLVMDPTNGQIVAATRGDWIGQAIDPALRSDLSMDAAETRPVQSEPIISPDGLSLVSSVPMRTGMMEEIDAVLVGVNLETRVGSLMEELQVYWQQRGVFRERTGNTFLAIAPDTIVTLPRYSMAPETTSGAGHPVFGLRAQSDQGTAEYTDQTGNSVLGAYEWLPEMGMGVVIEVPTETIFADLNSLFPFIVTLVVATGLLTLLLVLLITRRMLQPLGQLAEFGQRLARGDWDYRVPTKRQDEIGVVGYALNRMASELQRSYSTLEQRVRDRTQQVRTASEVARAVTSIPSLEDLLRQAVELIRQRFDYYHVSIFLVDDLGRFAVLRQSTGDVGQALISRGHKLAVGSDSIIGWVTANNEPRVSSEVTDDPIHFRNELLPETRSETAVPLQVAGTVLGALDVQSVQPNAFKDEDVEILQTLADQLSAAIQNARLAETSMEAAERSRLISEVTGQLSGLLDVDQVLNTAAHSLHQALGESEIMIKLTTPSGGDGQEL